MDRGYSIQKALVIVGIVLFILPLAQLGNASVSGELKLASIKDLKGEGEESEMRTQEQTTQANPLEYYARPGLMTDPKEHAELFEGLPTEISALCETVQGVLIHIFWAERYGVTLSDEREEEVNIRSVAGMLARIRELDDRPLTVARPLERRLVGNCRDFSTLLCAMLQYQGVPARTRCGFGAYFLPDHYEDHWICEYWKADEQRWVMVDAQLDGFQREALKIQFDPLDVPRDQFLTAGKGWLMCREGQADPESFGIFDMHGMWFIRGNVVRDLLSLNKIEILPWDGWGLAAKEEKDVSADDIALLDRIAKLTLAGNGAFSEIRSIYESDDRLRMPPDWKPTVKETDTVTDTKREYPQVLLKQVVKEFDDLIGRFGEHAVTAGEEVYPQPCVYLTFHLVQMRAAGWTDMDFDQLAAVSGASALFGHKRGDFMPKYANLSIGMDKRISDATGFGYEWVNFKGLEGAWELLKKSIDSGRSAKGWHWENIMFAGYQDAAKPEDRKVFAMADGPDTFAKWLTWHEFAEWVKLVEGWGCPQFGRHTERVGTKPAKEIALRVIKDLVEWSVNPPAVVLEKYPEATFGLAGMEDYAADCANTEEYEDWSACHDINPQWTVRNSTAVYLRRLAGDNVFPKDISVHLLAAAEEYRAAYENWQEFYEQLGHGAPEGAGKMKERRLAGAAAIRKALEHEKAAVAEIEDLVKKGGRNVE